MFNNDIFTFLNIITECYMQNNGHIGRYKKKGFKTKRGLKMYTYV